MTGQRTETGRVWPPRSAEEAKAGTSDEARVRTHVANGVGYVVLDRPAKRNALDDGTRKALIAALERIDADDRVRVVVLSGSGKSFAAGADLVEMKARSPDAQREFLMPPNIYGAVSELSCPVIACVNGHALGAGCELMMACDLRIAGDRAKIGQPEIRLGLIPGGGGTQRLPRLVGFGRAMRMVLSGEVVDAMEAARIGLVEECVPQDGLFSHVQAFAERMARLSPTALRQAKAAVRDTMETPLAEGLEREIDRFVAVFASEDAKEGIDAFLEGREPRFEGR